MRQTDILRVLLLWAVISVAAYCLARYSAVGGPVRDMERPQFGWPK